MIKSAGFSDDKLDSFRRGKEFTSTKHSNIEELQPPLSNNSIHNDLHLPPATNKGGVILNSRNNIGLEKRLSGTAVKHSKTRMIEQCSPYRQGTQISPDYKDKGIFRSKKRSVPNAPKPPIKKVSDEMKHERDDGVH